MNKIRVGVVGYGTIGKRITHAIQQQSDMDLIGIGVRSLNPGVASAWSQKVPIYSTDPSVMEKFSENGVHLAGTFEDLLRGIDVVIDCGTSGKSDSRLSFYQTLGKTVIFQGGENGEKIGLTYSSFANYEDAFGRTSVRIGSCNTTGLVRLLSTIKSRAKIRSVHAAMVRCATDPNKANKGIVNGAVPVQGPSHHAKDVQELLPDIPIYSQAIAVPMTHGHVAMLSIRLYDVISREQIIELLNQTPRIVCVKKEEGLSTAHLGLLAGGRLRDDRPELLVWEESIQIVDRELFIMVSIHMESIVVPETIDCIRSLTGSKRNRMQSIYQTDRAMGIAKSSECYGVVS